MKKNIVTIILGIIIMTLFCLHSIAVFHINDIVPVFPDSDSTEIEDAIIDGASLFFKANADIMLLYSECESNFKSYLDYSKCLHLVNSAVDHFTNSRARYIKAVSIGKSAGYKTDKIDLLKNFDYSGFALEKGFNSGTMDIVKGYLTKGDVIGIYRKAADDTENIITILNVIKKDLSNGVRPKITEFWGLLQAISKLMLFGNYSTVSAQHAFGNY